jgi:hypothetical protein
MENNEMTRNNISIQCHHVGAALQQVSEHVLIKKTNGVAMQCNIQSELAKIPMLSDFGMITFISYC